MVVMLCKQPVACILAVHVTYDGCLLRNTLGCATAALQEPHTAAAAVLRLLRYNTTNVQPTHQHV
jgi:hypothetical protein